MAHPSECVKSCAGSTERSIVLTLAAISIGATTALTIVLYLALNALCDRLHS